MKITLEWSNVVYEIFEKFASIFFFFLCRQSLIKVVDIYCVQSIDVTIHIEYILQNDFNVDEINVQIDEKIFDRKSFLFIILIFEIIFYALDCQFDFDSSNFLLNNILNSWFDINSKLVNNSIDILFEHFFVFFVDVLTIRAFSFFFSLALHIWATSKKNEKTFIMCWILMRSQRLKQRKHHLILNWRLSTILFDKIF